MSKVVVPVLEHLSSVQVHNCVPVVKILNEDPQDFVFVEYHKDGEVINIKYIRAGVVTKAMDNLKAELDEDKPDELY